MLRLLIALFLFPSFALADKWTKTTRFVKMLDNTYDFIENSNRTVSVVCGHGDVILLIDYKQNFEFLGYPDFIFRLDSKEPVAWIIDEVSSSLAIKKSAYYFVEGMVNSKKVTTRLLAESLELDKAIDTTGFADAYNSSKICRKLMADWKVEFEQPKSNANFRLLQINNKILTFVDNSYFDKKERAAWILSVRLNQDEVEKAIGSKGNLVKYRFDCKKRALRPKNFASYDQNGLFEYGSTENQPFETAARFTLEDDIVSYVCENKTSFDSKNLKPFSSVKSVFEFGTLFEMASVTVSSQNPALPISESSEKCIGENKPPIMMTEFDVDGAYPASAKKKELDGYAVIYSYISAEGNVVQNTISATNPVFASNSVRAEAEKQKFKPARVNCLAVAGTFTYSVDFKLKRE